MDPTADNSFFSNGGVAPAAQAPPMGFMLRKRLEQVTREKEAAMVRTARLVHAAARLFCCQLWGGPLTVVCSPLWRHVQAEIRTTRADIEREQKRAPRMKRGNIRPNAPKDVINARISELERDRVGRSMSLADEKHVLGEIRALEELRSHKERVQGLYDRVAELNKQLTTLNANITELRDGVRRCDLAQQISEATGTQVDVADVIDEVIDFDMSYAGRIVGKGGSNLKAMQSTYGVIVDLDRKSSKLTLTGTRASIDRAKLKVEEIVGEEEHTAKVSDGLRSFLVSGSFAGLHRLEEECGVRMQLPRDRGVAIIRGGARGVAKALGELRALEDAKRRLSVAPRVIPAVIGKGGANFRRIRKETGVEIQVEDRKRANAKATPETVITLYGEPEGVATALAELEALVEAGTEHTETVEIPEDMISWLVGKNGARIQAWQRAHSVSAQVRRPTAGVTPVIGGKQEEDEEDTPAPTPEPAAIVLRATSDKLAPAVAAVPALIAKFKEENVYLELNSAQALALIGNRGAGVNKLRADTGASIDIAVGGQQRRGRSNVSRARTLEAGQAIVRISGEPEQIAAAVAAVNEVVDKFVMETVDVSDRVIMDLLRNSGAGVNKLQEGVQVNLDIVKGKPLVAAKPADAPAAAEEQQQRRGRRGRRPQVHRGPGKIKISGDRDSVATAVERLQEVVAANYEAVVKIEADDFVGSLVGRGGSNIRALQAELGVAFDVLREAKQIVARGPQEQAEAAAEHIRQLQATHIRTNAVLKVPADMVSVLAGAGGSTLRSIEQETGAKLQTVRDGTVRITCEDEEKLAEAVEAVKQACGVDKDVGEVTFDPKYIGSVIGRGGSTLEALQKECDVVLSIVRARKVVVIRGDSENVARAKARIRTILREAVRVRTSVNFPQEFMGKLLGRGGANVRRLREETKAQIDLPPRSATSSRGMVRVEIFGTPDAVELARAEIQAMADGKDTFRLVLTPEHVAAIDERTRSSMERLQQALNAEIILQPATGTVRINGDTDAVTNAARSLEQLLTFAYKERYVMVDVAEGLAPILSGEQSQQPPRRKGGKGGRGKPKKAAAPATSPSEAKGEEDGGSGSELEDGEVSPADVAAAAGQAEDTSAEEAPKEAPIPTLKQLLAANEGVGGVVNTRGSYVSLWGEPEGIAAVRSAIDSAAATYAERNAEVAIQGWMVPALVGSRGSNIQKLEAESGTRIRVSERGTTRALVTVTGNSKAAVQASKAAIEAFVETLGVQEALPISNDGAGAIIGKGGSTIQRLQTETGASIDVDRRSGTCTIRGKRGEVESAKAQIEAILAEAGASSAASQIISCHRGDIGSVVGKGGEVIRALQSETGARVDIDKVRGAWRRSMCTHAPHAYTRTHRLISCHALGPRRPSCSGLVTFMPVPHQSTFG